LPLGSSVEITEQPVTDSELTGVSVSPAQADNGSSSTTARLTVQSGVTTATFTNRALGTIEVCKKAADKSTEGVPFQFSINGGPSFTVRAGQCSTPFRVPAGTATVSESAPSNFELEKVEAAPLGRLISGPTDNPATVSVPAGGLANETVVTFTNRVKTGQFKICKASPESGLQDIPFSFSISYTVNGYAVNDSASLKPGECSALSDPVPVVGSNGQPITVTVQEAPVAGTEISSIVHAGAGALTSSNTSTGQATFTTGIGNTTITYTNVRTPLVP
jgi:hypothetical protein